MRSRGENLCDKFEERVKAITAKSDSERVELMFLQQSYKRLMSRLDLYKEHEEYLEKKKKKNKRRLKQKKFDKVIMESLGNQGFEDNDPVMESKKIQKHLK